MANTVHDVLVTLSAKDTTPQSLPFAERRLILSSERKSIPIGRASKVKAKGFVSGPDNGWFDSPVMSRSHAEISADLDEKTVLIRDTGSLHGTFINGQETRVPKDNGHVLAHGDKLIFGVPIWRGKESFAPTIVQVGIAFNDKPSIVPRPTFQVPESSDVSDDDANSSDDDSSVREIEAQDFALPNPGPRGHLASHPIDLTPDNPPVLNPSNTTNKVGVPEIKGNKRVLIIDLSQDEESLDDLEVQIGGDPHVDSLPSQSSPQPGSEQQPVHGKGPLLENFAVDGPSDSRSPDPTTELRESTSHTLTFEANNSTEGVVSDTLFSPGADNEGQDLSESDGHVESDDHQFESDSEVESVSNVGSEGGVEINARNVVDDTGAPGIFDSLANVDLLGRLADVNVLARSDDLESELEDFDSEINDSEKDLESELKEMEWLGENSSEEEASDDASQESKLNTPSGPDPGADCSHAEGVLGDDTSEFDEEALFVKNTTATPNDSVQPGSMPPLAPVTSVDTKNTMPVRIDGLLNAPRLSTPTAPGFYAARADIWSTNNSGLQVPVDAPKDFAQCHTVQGDSAYSEAPSGPAMARQPSPSDAAMPSSVRAKVTPELLGVRSGKAEFFEAREQNKARAGEMEGCGKSYPSLCFYYGTSDPAHDLPRTMSDSVGSMKLDQPSRSDSSVSVQGSTAEVPPCYSFLEMGARFLNSPPPVVLSLSDGKPEDDFPVTSASDYQRHKMALKAIGESTPAVSRRTHVGISDIVDGCEQDSEKANKKRKAEEISKTNANEAQGQWENPQSKATEMVPPAMAGEMKALPLPVPTTVAHTTSVGTQAAVSAAVPAPAPALSQVSVRAVSDLSDETRPTKRPRMRDYIEPAGLVALGGLSVGAAVFALLVSTAPTFT